MSFRGKWLPLVSPNFPSLRYARLTVTAWLSKKGTVHEQGGSVLKKERKYQHCDECGSLHLLKGNKIEVLQQKCQGQFTPSFFADKIINTHDLECG